MPRKSRVNSISGPAAYATRVPPSCPIRLSVDTVRPQGHSHSNPRVQGVRRVLDDRLCSDGTISAAIGLCRGSDAFQLFAPLLECLMTSLGFAIIVFVVAFGATLLGLRLRRVLPAKYADEPTSASVKAIIGQMAMLTTVVLGFVTATAKSDFDVASSLVSDAASRIVTLDRILSGIGGQADDLRADLKQMVLQQIASIKSAHEADISDVAIIQRAEQYEAFHRRLALVEPASKTEASELQRAHTLMAELMQSRWIFSLDRSAELPVAFLLFILAWIALSFVYVGLYSADNWFVLFTAASVALCLASAMFLMLELEGPSSGFIRVSAAPLERALAVLGR